MSPAPGISSTLGDLAARLGCELVGDPDTEVSTVATLGNAGPGAIAFLANPAYRSQLSKTAASAVILSRDDLPDCPTDALIGDDPYLLYARVASMLYPRRAPTPGIHPTAVVDDSAKVHPDAQLAALTFVGERSEIGAGVFVGPGTVIGDDCAVGSGSHLAANVSLIEDVTIGERAIVHAGVVLGADGFGHKVTDTGWLKVPQVGGVRIGDDVEIGANTCVDRGAIDDTVIEDGVRLDNHIQIAHNCRIGAHTVIAAQAGVSGSTRIGRRCIIAGQVGFVGHISVCDDVVITGGAVVTKSITQPGMYSGSFPAEQDRDWKQRVVQLRRLDTVAKRLADLEKRATD